MAIHSKKHNLGDSNDHGQATLAELNALISDATLDDSSSARTPSAHDLDGSAHNGVSGAVENNFVSFDASGKPKDSGAKSSDFQAVSAKGQANGYASLDGSAKVPTSQLPDTVLGALDYQGVWDADTNSPDLPAATPTKGDYYKVSVAGSTSLGGITDWKVGDWAVYNGSGWDKVDNSETVSSVFGRTGAIVAASGDYGSDEITNDSTVSGATVTAALNSLETSSHAQSHAMSSTSDHTAGNWKLFHSNGSGEVAELALGGANAPLLGGGAAAAPSFGGTLIAPAVVSAAGAVVAASDLSAWGNNTIGVAVGTGGAVYFCFKNASGSFAVEMGTI